MSFERSVADHEAGISALGTLGAPAVIGTQLALVEGVRVNEGFAWTQEDGFRPLHTKQHVPFSPGYWERAWYEPAPGGPRTVEIAGLRVGLLICTEVMFNEHARRFGRQGVELIAVPRATPPITGHMFDVALQMAAVASGAYVASSNRSLELTHDSLFEGRGRIVSPLGETVAQILERRRQAGMRDLRRLSRRASPRRDLLLLALPDRSEPSQTDSERRGG